MTRLGKGAALAALLAAPACADRGELLAPGAPSLNAAAAEPAAWFSEFHYDNVGTDTGEAIEVMGRAGTDLSGWKVVLYNGSGGATYGSPVNLSGSIPDQCEGRGVVVINFPRDGLQNGAPDGFVLVDAAGAVIDALSYEGSFTAVGGPAAGTALIDIRVAETSSTPIGHSLKRDEVGEWQGPSAAYFGACNGGPPAPPPPPGPETLVIHELMGAPLAALSESWGEWFEVHNYGADPVNLNGWVIRSGGSQPAHRVNRNVVVPAGGYLVLGRADDRSRNGDLQVDYNYFVGSSSTIYLDGDDWLVLRSPAGTTVDSVGWRTLPVGATLALRDPAADNRDGNGPAWGYSTTPFDGGDLGTPGAPNGTLADSPPPIPTGVVRIGFAGRDGSDPPLPVGFQDQLFANPFDAAGAPVAEQLAWSSDTPALATVDAAGVVTALGAGEARVRATAANGRSAVFRLPTRVAVASPGAAYLGNAEFGEPTDADPSDDVLVRRAQFTASYSAARGTPNWVAYNLEATHFGAEDRCDCFTADPLVPAATPALTTDDYTGAGGFHGYGIDRGHLVRSADRTAGSLDNAVTYYFSNIIPQAADNNQGPWAVLENHLGDLARTGTNEVYVLAGVAGSRGTLRDRGRVVIPERVWKVAVVLPRDAGLAEIRTPEQLQLIVADLPNEAGIRDHDWRSYSNQRATDPVTIDALEARTGYDLLARLPDHIEWLVESGARGPSELSATRLLALLRTGIEEMAARGRVEHGNAQALLSKLGPVETQLAEGKNPAGPLGAFDNQVEALVRVGRLDPGDGDSLRTFASWIRGR